MFSLKKISAIVITLSGSALYAGTMGPVCDSINSTVPCESKSWSFGAKALYLKPSVNDDAQFALHDVGNENGVMTDYGADFTGQQSASYNWGFQIEGAYYFNTGNDLNINWYHIGKTNKQVYGAKPTITENWGPEGIYYATSLGSSSSINPKWDAVNIEFAQHVNFGERKSIRFHGGAQYARVTNNVTKYNLIGFEIGEIVNHTTTYNPSYNGFGPRVGADMTYDLNHGLGIYANAAAGILAGTRSYNATYTDSFTNAFRFNASNTAVVPMIDTKLGAKYTHPVAQGDLTFDAGWMWVNYFNIQETLAANINDFGLQGLYFGLKWKGNMA